MTRSANWENRIIGHADIDPATLAPHPLNYRLHPALQRSAMSETLERLGWVAEIIVNRPTSRVIDGHLRAELARERRVPTVPVTYVELSEDEERLALATFDPIGALAGTARDLLDDLLADLHPGTDALEQLFASMTVGAEVKAPTGDVDSIPDTPVVPTARFGDVWILGAGHRLWCGDATDRDGVRAFFAGEFARWVWTDPPWGVEYTGKDRDALTMANDTADGLRSLLVAAFASVDDVVADRSAIYVAHPAGNNASVFSEAFRSVGWHVLQNLVWVKDAFVLGHSDYHYRHEPILYGGKGGRPRWYGGRNVDSVFEIPRPRHNDGHPTIKPVELVQRHLACSSRRGQLGFDPFAGSGTTLLAAETLGRRCFAVELDPRYIDVAVRRLEQYSGIAAVLEGDGRTFAEIAEVRCDGQA